MEGLPIKTILNGNVILPFHIYVPLCFPKGNQGTNYKEQEQTIQQHALHVHNTQQLRVTLLHQDKNRLNYEK